MTDHVLVGVQLQAQHASWAELYDAALLVNRLNYDALMTWDHFMPVRGSPMGDNLEGWQLLAAWAAITKRVRLGPLVTAVTYRHPSLVAKMAATLDHISGGRAILGLGAGWFEPEHSMYGIVYPPARTRSAMLAEAVPTIRSLLDQPRTTFVGAHYHFDAAVAEPKPIQQKLPLLIGGGGERWTLPLAARYADMWHGFGSPDELQRKIELLRCQCDKIGRDFEEITPITGGAIVIRDDGAEVDGYLRQVSVRSVGGGLPPVAHIGSVRAIAERLREYIRVGIRGFIFEMTVPFDAQTLERLQSEVRPLLGAAGD